MSPSPGPSPVPSGERWPGRGSGRGEAIVYTLLFLVSAATLALQIALTRVFSLAQWYHFAFMSVSIGLLGFGASGSLLYLAPKLLGRHREGVAIAGEAGEESHRDPSCRSALGTRHPGGSSGDALPRPPAPDARPTLDRDLAVAALLFAGATALSYPGANRLPLDVYLLGIDPLQWVLLLGYFALLALPFLFAGGATGLALSRAPGRAGRLYFASMVGSGCGALGSLWLLSALPPGEAVVAIALCLALGVSLWATWRRSLLLAPALLVAAATAGSLLALPDLVAVRTSPYKALNQALLYPGARVVWQGQNAFSQVSLLESPGVRSAPGLSLAYQGRLPPQHAVSTDGEKLSPVLPYRPGTHDFVRYLPSAAAYRLLSVRDGGMGRARYPELGTGDEPSRPPSVLLLEPGGGLEAVVALEHGADPVTVVVGNRALVQAVRRVEGSYLEDPRVRLVGDGARSFLASGGEPFDLIVMPLADSFRVVTAGAFSISENYLLTVESVARQYERLAEGGFLVVSRWLQLPPSEELRSYLIALEALERLGVERPASRVAAFRSFQTATLLVKRGELTPREVDELRTFAAEMRYDLIHLPGLRAEDANRFHLLERDLYFETYEMAESPGQRADLLSIYPFDVSPTTDDRPFFHHFFKPAQLPEVVSRLGRTWQPFGGSGYLVMFALLAFAVAASALLIALPLWVGSRGPADGGAVRHGDGETRGRGEPGARDSELNPGARPLAVLAYFGGLGVAYLFVEIPLMQRMILFLDQPTYSFAAVLCALLLSSGLGSLAAERLGWRPGAVLLALAVGALLSAAALPPLLAPFLAQPLALRFLVALVALAPLGFLMGMPFPMGVALLGKLQPSLVPWAWAINGCASVVSSILASMIALSAGFGAVLALAGAAYGVAALAAGSASWSAAYRCAAPR